MPLFDRLKKGLKKTKESLAGKIETILAGKCTIDDDLFEELEEILIQADVGVDTSVRLVEELRARVKENRLKEPGQLKVLLMEIIQDILDGESTLSRTDDLPLVILVVGVNGDGKTTTIGKLAYHFRKEGQKVILAAADTFRAAAAEQLEIWGRRTGAEVIRQKEGSDAAAVAYDALKAARARKAGVLIVDTAGRQHTKSNLMEELKKISRVLARELPGAPHETLLILDATTGQNSLAQAKVFKEATGITGVIMTKLDSTAKGGVIISIREILGLPVKFVGIGEKMEDLQPFHPGEFVHALFS